jgi:mRNA interferase MazF
MVNKWDIYYCSLDPVESSEQRGSRPVLVVSNNAVNHSIPVSTVLPFSSVKEGASIYPTEVFLPPEASGLQKDSVVMIQQIRTLSHKRLTQLVSRLESQEYQGKVLDALRDYFEYA